MKFKEISLGTFLKELGSATPTPGGGSVAALCGSLGAALVSMVSGLTLGKEAFKDSWQVMEEVKLEASKLSHHFCFKHNIEFVQNHPVSTNNHIASARCIKHTSNHFLSAKRA